MPLPDLSKYEKFQDLTNGRVRYYELGSGTNHTLLLHGMGYYTSADTFQYVIEELGQHLHILAPDYLGFGKSTRKLEHGPTFDVIVDSLREFMDVKGIERADLVGHSAGAWFGLLLAYESPDRLRKLISIGGAGMNTPPYRGGVRPTRERIANSVSGSVFDGSALTPDLAEPQIEQMAAYATAPDAFEGLAPLIDQMENAEKRKQYLLHRRLPHIKTPTMVMWGKGDTMDPYPTWTEEYERLNGDMSKSSKPWTIPGAKYVMTPGGHNSHWETPQLFIKHVLEFLNE
jgi:4,5:9,10-diseco-3-hydroxy-5,9,17-trioxoandrosta-1(10),2-diene-4-oate hydrolase